MKSANAFPIVIACVVFVVIGIAVGLLNIAWTYMQVTFGVSHDSLAALAPATMLGGLIAAFLSGTLIGKFGLAPVLVAGMAFAGFGLLGYSIAPVWIVLLAVAFFTSIGKGTIDAALNNFVSVNYGTSEMNWLHASWGIGLTIAPSIVTYFVIDQGSGWQSGYVLIGSVILLLGVIILLSLPAWQFKVKRGDKEKPRRRTPMTETLSQPIVLMGLSFFFLYGASKLARASWPIHCSLKRADCPRPAPATGFSPTGAASPSAAF